ncbi:MAG: hypothetical protein FWD17_05640 [Polyangiaceae bacterium]|nr:hypothetical protein [Polyangiaceae bacterium]
MQQQLDDRRLAGGQWLGDGRIDVIATGGQPGRASVGQRVDIDLAEPDAAAQPDVAKFNAAAEPDVAKPNAAAEPDVELDIGFHERVWDDIDVGNDTHVAAVVFDELGGVVEQLLGHGRHAEL